MHVEWDFRLLSLFLTTWLQVSLAAAQDMEKSALRPWQAKVMAKCLAA